jgi:dienelactone hydrolase
MFDCLNGKKTAKRNLHLTDILAHPAAVPTLEINVLADPKLFGWQAGTRFPVVLVVMYPTANDNPRSDYTFPYKDTGDKVFPHMQQPGERPVFADPSAKYPLIVLSDGCNAHALWHLTHLKFLASHGYIVADVGHRDGRGATLTGNLALRLLEVRATIDWLLQQPDWAHAIDAEHIGATGQSAGGHTVLAAMGGTDPAGRIAGTPDPRIEAGFGLVPFMGGNLGVWPFKIDGWYFGKDHAGLRSVHAPFFAVYGEKGTNVPPDGVEARVREIAGPAAAVMLDGEKHLLSNDSVGDANTRELSFFDAWLRGDAKARRQLHGGTSVRGGVTDHKTIQHVAR